MTLAYSSTIGSFGSICSAATVAASSFDMKVTDPSKLLSKVDWKLFDKLRAEGKPRREFIKTEENDSVQYAEPTIPEPPANAAGAETKADPTLNSFSTIKSKVITLGDFIDTDQVDFPDTAPRTCQILLTSSRWLQQILSCSVIPTKTWEAIPWSILIRNFEAK